MKIHITKQGESLETIANTYSVSRQDLTGINPHVNLASELVPGLKLKIPDASRVEKDHHIEKFYPNLDHQHHQYMKEQAVPIGLKPFDEPHTHTLAQHPPTAHPPHPQHPDGAIPMTNQHQPPWGHLAEHTTHLTPESVGHYHPWNHPFPPFAPQQDARAIIPPLPYYPPYPPAPYPPYGYPPYGYGIPVPIPVPGFASGYGFGHGHGWHGGGHGWHGGGYGHGGGHHRSPEI